MQPSFSFRRKIRAWRPALIALCALPGMASAQTYQPRETFAPMTWGRG
jgi:hypothetical protein